MARLPRQRRTAHGPRITGSDPRGGARLLHPQRQHPTPTRQAALASSPRSDSMGRCGAWVEPPPGIAAGAASPGWAALAELGWPGMLAPESVGGLALGLT